MSDPVSMDAYIISYLGAYEALRRASEQASAMSQNMALDDDVRARAGALSLDLGVQLFQLKVAHEALMNTFTTVNPPSKPIVDRAVAQAKELAALVADNLLAQGKLEAVMGIIGAIGAIPNQPVATAAEVNKDTPAVAALMAAQMETTTSRWLVTLRDLVK